MLLWSVHAPTACVCISFYCRAGFCRVDAQPHVHLLSSAWGRQAQRPRPPARGALVEQPKCSVPLIEWTLSSPTPAEGTRVRLVTGPSVKVWNGRKPGKSSPILAIFNEERNSAFRGGSSVLSSTRMRRCGDSCLRRAERRTE